MRSLSSFMSIFHSLIPIITGYQVPNQKKNFRLDTGFLISDGEGKKIFSSVIFAHVTHVKRLKLIRIYNVFIKFYLFFVRYFVLVNLFFMEVTSCRVVKNTIFCLGFAHRRIATSDILFSSEFSFFLDFLCG